MVAHRFVAVVSARVLPKASASQVAAVVRFFLDHGWGRRLGRGSGRKGSLLRWGPLRRSKFSSCFVELPYGWVLRQRARGLRRMRVKGGKTLDIPLPSAVIQFLAVYVERVLAKQSLR